MHRPRFVVCLVILWIAALLGSASVYATSVQSVAQVIATWRSQSPSGAQPDLSLLEKNSITKTEMITALATLVKEDDTQGAVFAIRVLSALLEGSPIDSALLSAFQSPEAAVRVQAAAAMGMIQDKDFMLTLVTRIQQQYPSDFLNLATVIRTSLSFSNEPIYLAESLTKLAVNDPQQGVRQTAAMALAEFLGVAGIKDVVPKLLGATETPDAAGEVAVWVVDALASDAQASIATWIQVLAATNSPDVIPALAMFFKTSDVQTAWTAAQMAKGLAGDKGVFAILTGALGSKSVHIRLATMRSLEAMAGGLYAAVEAQIGSTKQAQPELVAGVLRGLEDPEPEVRWAAAQGLSGWFKQGANVSGGADALVKVVSDSTTPERVRAVGAQLLAKIAPSALQNLAEGRLLQVLHRLDPVYSISSEGYHTFRIPAILVSPQGTLLAFAEGRRFSRSDTGDIDLVLKRSEDNGVTWSPLQVIWDGGGRHTAGNPTPVVDEQTGRIWLFMTHNLGQDSQDKIQKGTSEGVRTIWATYSDDDGLTWAAPTNLFAVTQDATTRWDATGPGVGIQLRLGEKAGRLIIPAIGRSIYSDDHGQTWKQGSKFGGTSESQIVELTDGRLLRNDRAVSRLVPNRRPITLSTDQGLTWGKTRYAPELVESYVQASTIRYEPADSTAQYNNILLFSNPAHATVRVNMTVKVSLDEGETWPIAKTIHPGPSAYSCLVRLPDNTLGLLFEGGTNHMYDHIYFTRFTLDWLLDERQTQ